MSDTVEKKLLNENELFALILTERNAVRYQTQDLPAKKQELDQAKAHYELKQRELTLIEGGIQGAQIQVLRYLEQAGVDFQTYTEQKQAFLKSELEKQNASKTDKVEPVITPDEIIKEAPELEQPQVPAELVKDDDSEEPKVVKVNPTWKKKKARGQ